MSLRRAGFFRELEHGDPSGPSIVAARGRLDERVRDRAARYLTSGSALGTTGAFVNDALDPSKGQVASLATRTDGVWVWPSDLAYYVATYGVALPEEFLVAMESAGWRAAELTQDALLRAEKDLFDE